MRPWRPVVAAIPTCVAGRGKPWRYGRGVYDGKTAAASLHQAILTATLADDSASGEFLERLSNVLGRNAALTRVRDDLFLGRLFEGLERPLTISCLLPLRVDPRGSRSPAASTSSTSSPDPSRYSSSSTTPSATSSSRSAKESSFAKASPSPAGSRASRPGHRGRGRRRRSRRTSCAFRSPSASHSGDTGLCRSALDDPEVRTLATADDGVHVRQWAAPAVQPSATGAKVNERPTGGTIVATETIHILIATLSCDQMCNDFQWLLY